MNAEGLPQKGDVIAGKFQVEDVLGAGGMGVVIAARHLVLRQRVAVKFLLPQATRLPEASERFIREARAAVAIQSEHVARVLDVGTLENGAPYMVMEFLAGTDLGKLLRKQGPLPIPDAVDYILQAGEALAEAHGLGIVHRDLKPGNLFLTTRPEGSPLVKVLDFGLSKMAAQDDGAPETSLTATGFVMGSPQYMSPEQVRSLKHVDWRTDIWALGVIIYEMLTGRRPFDGPSLTAVSASIVLDTPKPMRAWRPEVPPAIEAAVLACLEKDREHRTQSVSALAQAIAPFAPTRSWPSVERIVRLSSGAATAPIEPAAEPAATVTLPITAPPEVALSPHAAPPRPRAAEPAPPPRVMLASAPPAEPPPIARAVESAPAPRVILASTPPAEPPPRVAQASVSSVEPPAPPPRAALPSVPSSHVAPTTGSAWGQTQPVANRATMKWLAGALAAVLVVMTLATAWVLRGSRSAAQASPSGEAPPAIAAAATATAIATATAKVLVATATAEMPSSPSPPSSPAASASAPTPTVKQTKPTPSPAHKPTPKPEPPKSPKRPASVLDNPN